MTKFELTESNINKLDNNTIIIKNYCIYNEILNEVDGTLYFCGKINNESNIMLYSYYCFNRQQFFKQILSLGKELYCKLKLYNTNIEDVLYRNITHILGKDKIYSIIKKWLRTYGYPYKTEVSKFENYYKNIKAFENTDIEESFNITKFIADIIQIYIIFNGLNEIRTLYLHDKMTSGLEYEFLKPRYLIVNEYQILIDILKRKIPQEIYENEKKEIKERIYINSKYSFDIGLLDTKTTITEQNLLEKLNIFEEIIFSYLYYKIKNDKNCNIEYNELIIFEKKGRPKYFSANIYDSVIGFCYNELKYTLTKTKPCKNPKCNKLISAENKKNYCSEKCKKEGRKNTNAMYYANKKNQS